MTNRQVKKKVCGLSLWFFTLVWVKTVWIIFSMATGRICNWPNMKTCQHLVDPQWKFQHGTGGGKTKMKNAKKNINCTFVCFFGLLHVFCKNQASRIFTATEPKWKPGVLNLGQTWARLPKISPRRQKARKNLSIWHSALSFVIEEESSVANGLWVLRLDDLRG